jgi:1-acyl-sn-glycerol-3-phosphate acyltransferase
MLFLRALVFYTIMALSTLVYAPLISLAILFPFRFRYRAANHWVHLNLAVLERICHLRFQVEGVKRIPDGPAVIFAKHQSAWETLGLQVIFPPLVWVLKKELLWIPVFGWALAMMRPIAIDRRGRAKAIRQIVAQGIERLERGLWVVVFPEGTRVAPGERRRYRVGGAVLAEQAAVPVVPVAHNAGRFWPRRGFVKYPGTIRVAVGSPIHTAGRSAAQINAMAEQWIESRVALLDAGEPIPAE